MFNELSCDARNLLKDLLDCESSKTISLSGLLTERIKKEKTYRRVVGELIDNKSIDVKWADNMPYIVNILSAGSTYFEKTKGI